MKIEKGQEFNYPYQIGMEKVVEKIVITNVSDSHVWFSRLETGITGCVTDRETFISKARRIKGVKK